MWHRTLKLLQNYFKNNFISHVTTALHWLYCTHAIIEQINTTVTMITGIENLVGIINKTLRPTQMSASLCTVSWGAYLCVQLKKLNHDNVISFIGASIEPGHLCYLMQHCSRGTVQVSVNWQCVRVAGKTTETEHQPKSVHQYHDNTVS